SERNHESESTDVGQLSTADKNLLLNFRNIMKKLHNNLCSIYNEQFLSIQIVKDEYRCCYNKKSLPKKFSARNNMVQ
ncbi:3961_t:CDS:1, partial [Racocetra persica]